MKRKTRSEKCAMCGGNRVLGKTLFSADLGGGVVAVRNVPATVCEQCGETWIANDAAHRLEEISNAARKKHRLVEILPY